MTNPHDALHDSDLDWDDWLAEAEAAFREEPETLTDADVKMDRLLEVMVAIEREIERDKEVAAARIAQVEDWLDRRTGRLDQRLHYIRSTLEALAAQTDFGRAKSRELPHGRVGFRRKAATVEWLDKTHAREWAEKNCPDAVRVRESKSVVKGPLIEYAKAREIDPAEAGFRYVPEGDDFYVTPNTKD